MGLRRPFDVGASVAATVFRAGAGGSVGRLGARPERPLELYEFEACPYCRLVREVLSTLDLDARIHPCPRGGRRFRPHVRERGGIEMFPFLVDPNAGVEMYESADIVAHLQRCYGDSDGGAPRRKWRGPLSIATAGLATFARVNRGSRARPSREPPEPLELYSFESSPFCRIVREILCELELPYLLRNVARRSPRRPELVARAGKMQVPYLIDPNTGAEMFESADIMAYLEETYAV